MAYWNEASAGASAFYYNSSGAGTSEGVQECHQISGAFKHVQNSSAQTGIVKTADVEENYYWRRSDQLSPYPGWQGAGAGAGAAVEAAQVAAKHAFGMVDQAGGNTNVNMVVSNLHVNIHHYPATANGTATQRPPLSEERPRIDESQQQAADVETQQLHFHANDPDFHLCTSDAQGLDFGHKVVTRFYRAQKHVHSSLNMISYTQYRSTAQAISHAVTINLSHKRSKHTIFVFDCGLDVRQITSDWPSIIYFRDIKTLIQQLGPEYEYHRCKPIQAKNRRSSLYIYLVKRFGVRFSEQGRRSWSGLSQWAHSAQGASLATAGSVLSSSQSIAQAIGIGLTILGGI